MDTITQETKQTAKKKPPVRLILILVVALVVCVAIFALLQGARPKEPTQEVITISTLEDIINISELSTFTAVYNGIAEVSNEKKPEKIDYYVSYEAKVNAGIDFEQIVISVDNETKVIKVAIPEIRITDVIVDITSLDFIFENDKANTSTITQQAFKACEADVTAESQTQGAIFELARQNAENILTALVKPIIEQLDEEYKLVVE